MLIVVQEGEETDNSSVLYFGMYVSSPSPYFKAVT